MDKKMKTRIFAVFTSDGDGYDIISKIGLNLNVFKGEEDIYFQDIDSKTETTDEDSWKPYNGTQEIYGYIDVKTNKFHIDDNSCPFLPDEFFEDPSKQWGNMIEIYKDGELIETKFEKEE